jgi:hypothetical protein
MVSQIESAKRTPSVALADALKDERRGEGELRIVLVDVPGENLGFVG